MIYEPVWSGIIACYLFLGGLGGGAFATGAVLAWRHPQAKGMRKWAHAIGFVTVLVGLVLLMFDAKAGFMNPLRFAFLLSNFGSVMTWGVVFLAVFLVVSFVAFLLDILKHFDKFHGEVPLWLELIGAVMGVCVAIYTGCLLGVCKTFPLWNNALLPVLFFVSAMSTGMASVLLAAVFRHPDEFNQMGTLKKVHYIFHVVEMFLVVSLLAITSTVNDAGATSVAALVCGKYAVVFWVLFVIVGLVVPVATETRLLFFSSEEFERSSFAHGVSAVSDIAVLVGGFMLRLLILLAAVPVTMAVPWTL